jgi:hypothetical protein
VPGTVHLAGGPVSRGGFVVRPRLSRLGTLGINERGHRTAARYPDIGNGKAQQSHIVFSYSGWGPGQLEQARPSRLGHRAGRSKLIFDADRDKVTSPPYVQHAGSYGDHAAAAPHTSLNSSARNGSSRAATVMSAAGQSA